MNFLPKITETDGKVYLFIMKNCGNCSIIIKNKRFFLQFLCFDQL